MKWIVVFWNWLNKKLNIIADAPPFQINCPECGMSLADEVIGRYSGGYFDDILMVNGNTVSKYICSCGKVSFWEANEPIPVPVEMS